MSSFPAMSHRMHQMSSSSEVSQLQPISNKLVSAPGMALNKKELSEIDLNKKLLTQDDAFWKLITKEISEIDYQSDEFRSQTEIPLRAIRRVMTQEGEVGVNKVMFSAESPILFAKACEVFILQLTLKGWGHCEKDKRRILSKADVVRACHKSEMYDFLVDIIPQKDQIVESRQHPQTAPAALALQQTHAQQHMGLAPHAPQPLPNAQRVHSRQPMSREYQAQLQGPQNVPRTSQALSGRVTGGAQGRHVSGPEHPQQLEHYSFSAPIDPALIAAYYQQQLHLAQQIQYAQQQQLQYTQEGYQFQEYLPQQHVQPQAKTRKQSAQQRASRPSHVPAQPRQQELEDISHAQYASLPTQSNRTGSGARRS